MLPPQHETTSDEPGIIAALPTLLRFLAIIATIGGIGFGAVFALATFVEPEQREMTATIPASRLGR